MANPLEPTIIFQPIIPAGTNYHNSDCEEATKGYLKKNLDREYEPSSLCQYQIKKEHSEKNSKSRVNTKTPKTNLSLLDSSSETCWFRSFSQESKLQRDENRYIMSLREKQLKRKPEQLKEGHCRYYCSEALNAMKEANFDEAERLLRASKDSLPKRPTSCLKAHIHELRFYLRHLQGRYSEAMEALEKSLALGHPQSIWNMAMIELGLVDGYPAYTHPGQGLAKLKSFKNTLLTWDSNKNDDASLLLSLDIRETLQTAWNSFIPHMLRSPALIELRSKVSGMVRELDKNIFTVEGFGVLKMLKPEIITSPGLKLLSEYFCKNSQMSRMLWKDLHQFAEQSMLEEGYLTASQESFEEFKEILASYQFDHSDILAIAGANHEEFVEKSHLPAVVNLTMISHEFTLRYIEWAQCLQQSLGSSEQCPSEIKRDTLLGLQSLRTGKRSNPPPHWIADCATTQEWGRHSLWNMLDLRNSPDYIDAGLFCAETCTLKDGYQGVIIKAIALYLNNQVDEAITLLEGVDPELKDGSTDFMIGCLKEIQYHSSANGHKQIQSEHIISHYEQAAGNGLPLAFAEAGEHCMSMGSLDFFRKAILFFQNADTQLQKSNTSDQPSYKKQISTCQREIKRLEKKKRDAQKRWAQHTKLPENTKPDDSFSDSSDSNDSGINGAFGRLPSSSSDSLLPGSDSDFDLVHSCSQGSNETNESQPAPVKTKSRTRQYAMTESNSVLSQPEAYTSLNTALDGYQQASDEDDLEEMEKALNAANAFITQHTATSRRMQVAQHNAWFHYQSLKAMRLVSPAMETTHKMDRVEHSSL